MGAHKHVYLGAYVECTFKKATRVIQVYGCSNGNCPRHPKKEQPAADGKFCTTCAKPNAKVPVIVPDRPSSYDVVGDALFDIYSSDPDVVYLGPNQPRPGAPEHYGFESGDEVHVDFTEMKPIAERKWFEQAFAKELELLRGAYATVTVKWGLHQYFM